MGIPTILDRFEFFFGVQGIRSKYSIKQHPLRALVGKHEINTNLIYNDRNISQSVLYKGNHIIRKYEYSLYFAIHPVSSQPFKSLYMYNPNLHTKKNLRCNTNPISEDPMKKETEIFFFSDNSVEKNQGQRSICMASIKL